LRHVQLLFQVSRLIICYFNFSSPAQRYSLKWSPNVAVETLTTTTIIIIIIIVIIFGPPAQSLEALRH